MILRGILSRYETDPAMVKRARPGTGNPTGSAFGKCTAQLQALRYPEISKPTGTRPRGLMTFENGDMIEKWWSEKIEAAYPGMSGFAQEPFYFPTPVTQEQAEEIERRMKYRYGVPGAIWGRRVDGFLPPWIKAENGALTFRLMAEDAKKIGFVLDRLSRGAPVSSDAAGTLWSPTYIDRAMILNGEVVAIEKKAVSSFAFKRMVLGIVDRMKMAQLAGIAEALQCNVVMLAYRKDTAHLLEIYFTRESNKTEVKILRSNGQEDSFMVDNGQLVGEDGAPSTLADKDWDCGEIKSPYAPHLLEEIRARIIRVLLADPDQTTWRREYGPSFLCKVCGGAGTQTTRKGTRVLLKAPKPCEDCSMTGKMETAVLPEFPCSYCNCVQSCWEGAGVRLEIVGNRPKYVVSRDKYEASGLTFYPPTLPTEPVVLETDDEQTEPAT